MGQINTTATFFQGGITEVTALPKIATFTVGGTWVQDETWVITLLLTSNGFSTVVGRGLLAGVYPQVVFTFDKKVYVGAGSVLYFSAIDQPTVFNNADSAGNGYIEMSNSTGTMGDIKALASYQGKLAVISRNVTQILATDPDPTLYAVVQTLENIGTVATKSVKAVGDLDIYMLSDSGFRSLRVRDASSNATTADIGTPVDSVVQDTLLVTSEATKARAVSFIEPNTNRYWCFFGGSFLSGGGIAYTFSNFRESGIAAWSTSSPQFPVGVDVFDITPTDAVIFKGRVYLRGYVNGNSGNLFAYGGTDGATYDTLPCTFETYYMDAKNPSDKKHLQSIDALLTGSWVLSVGMDPVSGTLTTVFTDDEATPWQGRIACAMSGYFLKMKGVAADDEAATFDAMSFLYKSGERS